MNNSQSIFPKNPIYGQSYVPIQYLNKTYKPDEGLKMGSLFPELVMKYSPGQSIEENIFIKNINDSRKEFNDDL
jgi:hypothetical protein